MHGALCFRGTRVPLEMLLNDLKSGYSIDDFLDGCPTVTRAQVGTLNCVSLVPQYADLLTRNRLVEST
jgi:uncharacterized protein (DUF433 family)